VHDDAEVTLWIKVSSDDVGGLRDRLVELHDYDVPEVVVLPADVERSYAPYVQWVRAPR
jgi:periplasmic divalent cation tolerance protein